MTNKEILKAVLEKAIDNGYEINQASFDYLMNILRKNDDMASSAVEYYIKENKYFDNIFSHEFAKAFWGEGHDTFQDGDHPRNLMRYYFQDDKGNDIFSHLIKWQYYLQQMILEKEPLKYLKKFL